MCVSKSSEDSGLILRADLHCVSVKRTDFFSPRYEASSTFSLLLEHVHTSTALSSNGVKTLLGWNGIPRVKCPAVFDAIKL